MQITLASLFVEDQDRALAFYTGIVGFEKKHDIPMGTFRWLTVVSPEGAAGVELVLEPMAFPPARTFQKALFDADIPATAFMTKDIAAEYARLKARGVKFRGEPIAMGPITAVMFEDGCGNLVNLVQPAGGA
ncbi:VOC family protein [Ramlibacter humi]|uniref:VOC family protein n=1 Tax=Ramlibacter humi TaxID=2530451 RepID=A0A4Z0CB68_9BURK|nr:VOC family protein [Ramlibacter humi]TFZ07658.1 VOC family protein [Ramlibacter humi]